jgi:hypothetical protein
LRRGGNSTRSKDGRKAMNAWDWALLGAAGFVAIGVLARLMSRRRDDLLTQLRHAMEVEQQKQRRAEAQKKEQEKQKAAARPPTPAQKTK